MQSFLPSVQSYCSSTHTTAPQRTAACTTPVETSSFFPPHIDQKPPNFNKRCCSTLCMFYEARPFGRRPVLAKHFLESPVGNSARCLEKITSAKIFWDSDKFTTYGFWNIEFFSPRRNLCTVEKILSAKIFWDFNFLLHTASGTCNFFCRRLSESLHGNSYVVKKSESKNASVTKQSSVRLLLYIYEATSDGQIHVM